MPIAVKNHSFPTSVRTHKDCVAAELARAIDHDMVGEMYQDPILEKAITSTSAKEFSIELSPAEFTAIFWPPNSFKKDGNKLLVSQWDNNDQTPITEFIDYGLQKHDEVTRYFFFK